MKSLDFPGMFGISFHVNCLHEADYATIPNPSALSAIHYTLAELHRLGRLAQIDKLNFEEAVKAGVQKDDLLFDEKPSLPGMPLTDVASGLIVAAYFHYQTAAFLGSIEACLLLAHVHSPNQSIFEGHLDMSDGILACSLEPLICRRS